MQYDLLVTEFTWHVIPGGRCSIQNTGKWHAGRAGLGELVVVAGTALPSMETL